MTPFTNASPEKLPQRFDMAVFLTAIGLREREAAFEADQHAYPYSPYLRRGLGMLAELCVECAGEKAASLLDGLGESNFIREWCTKDVIEWTRSWSDEAREAVASARFARFGPLAEVEGDFFTPTEECLEIVFTSESDVIGAYQEREVYEFLRQGTQEQYAFGRRLIARHPVITWDELQEMKTGRYRFSDDPLDQGEAALVDPDWTSELLGMAYERVPEGTRVCPSCGWTMSLHGKQPSCTTRSCVDPLPARFEELEISPRDGLRLTKGVMRYIALPGKLEIAIAEKARDLGLNFEMWPLKDTCDVLVTLPDGRTVAADAKAYARPQRLARELALDTGISRLRADLVVYVVPDRAEKDHPGFCRTCNHALQGKGGRSCATFSTFGKALEKAARKEMK